MTTAWTRFEGAFIGHALASSYDPSLSMALNVAESLLQCQGFNGPDILAKHLYLYHTKRCEIGQITKCVYEEVRKRMSTQGTLTSEQFRFDQSTIDAAVQTVHEMSDGHTAGCSPAQRSYPLAFCMYIRDDDLTDAAMAEAKLTHHSPLAGQVAVIVNLICRSLIQGNAWADAVAAAFTTPNLHSDMTCITARFSRHANLLTKVHPSYAPGVLTAALHYVSSSSDAIEAIRKARQAENSLYCAPIVGILAGARWGIPETMYKEHVNHPQLIAARVTANKLANLWSTKPGGVSS